MKKDNHIDDKKNLNKLDFVKDNSQEKEFLDPLSQKFLNIDKRLDKAEKRYEDFQNKIENNNRKSINSLAIFSFLISLFVILLNGTLNVLAPLAQIFSKEDGIFLGSFYIILMIIAMIWLFYFSFSKLLNKVAQFWIKEEKQ